MRAKRRSPCPVSCSLELFGDRWTLLVIRDLFCGKSTFKDFHTSPEKIATNILANRLQQLVKHGLVVKQPVEDDQRSEEYALTAKGLSLRPVLEAMRDWGLSHIAGTQARLHSP